MISKASGVDDITCNVNWRLIDDVARDGAADDKNDLHNVDNNNNNNNSNPIIIIILLTITMILVIK